MSSLSSATRWVAGVLIVAVSLSAHAYAEEPPVPPPAPPPLPPVIVASPAPMQMTVVPPANPCTTCPPPPCCFQRRDSCSWQVDRCCRRLGRFEVSLQGTYTYITDPEHAFGVDTFLPDQVRWDTLEFDGEPGGRAAVRYAVGPLDWIEARFAYLGEFDDQRRQTGVAGYAPAAEPPPIPGVAPGVAGPFTADFSMESTLWTAELNWWSEWFCDGRWRVDTVVGARVISFEEDAEVNSVDPGFNPGFPGDPFVRSETDNLFLGVQAGARVHWDIHQCFELNASLKGLLGNLNRETVVTDNSVFSGGPHSASLEEDEFVWGFEAEVGARWRLLRWLSLEAGYSLLFLDNVQRANDAMNFGASLSGAVQAQSNPDQLFAHSVFAGITLQF
jgi:Putative beta barrel porin-7 (BBP7)